MGVSRQRRAHDLERRIDKLRMRAALAQGEERDQLWAEIEPLTEQLKNLRG